MGVPPLQASVKQGQHDFFVKMNPERNGAVDEHFNFAMDLTRNYNARTFKQLDGVMQCDDHVSSAVEFLKNQIPNSDRTQFIIYRTINPTIDMPAVHSRLERENLVDDHHRLSFSRFRLSSHNLKTETGRWFRQPREVFVCACVDRFRMKCTLSNFAHWQEDFDIFFQPISVIEYKKKVQAYPLHVNCMLTHWGPVTHICFRELSSRW